MPRIRTIKPELWQDEKLAVLDPLTRLVFLGLISMADDAGRVVDNIKSIDGFIFPETEDTAKDAVGILTRLSRLQRYEAPNGQRIIQIVNWARHQRVDHPNKYVLPGPTAEVLSVVRDTPVSVELRENSQKPSRNVLATTSTPTPTSTPTNDPKSQAAGAAPLDTTDGQIMAAIRTHLYHPDGKPPEGWEEGREFSIMRQLRKLGKSGAQIMAVVEGLGELRRDSRVDWLTGKVTLRAVYNSKSGCLDMWGQAEDAYYRIGKTAGKAKKSGPVPLSDLIPRSA